MYLQMVQIEEHFSLCLIALLWLHPVGPDAQNRQREDWLIGLLPCSAVQTKTSNYVCDCRSQSSFKPTMINQMNDSLNRFSVHWNWAAITINANPWQGHSLNCKLVIIPVTLSDSAQAKWQQTLLVDLTRDLGGISIDPLQLQIYVVYGFQEGTSVSTFTALMAEVQ